jgi:DNA repair exonuclease SbcCD ATPase subunit
MIATFRIHPEIESYIRKQSEEENSILEESLLAEGCRDPLVVWEEQNVLVDGHHRIAICRKHGLSYSVVYRSFPDIEAVKAWMDLNQLGRRNLSKEDRDELIRRLAAAGVSKKAIAEKIGLTQRSVQRIVPEGRQNFAENPINFTSATEELEAKQQEIERLRAEKDSLAERHRHEVEARARAEGDLISVKNQLEFLRNKAPTAEIEAKQSELDSLRKRLKDEQDERDRERKELVKALNEAQAKAKQTKVPEVVEKEVVREVIPDRIKEQLARLEGDLQAAKSRETELERLIQDAKKHGKDIETLLSQKNDIQKSLKELSEKNDLAQEERQQALALVSAARKIREVLNEQKGLIEEASRKGVPAWTNAVSIRECAERCYEIGDLLTKATETIDIPTGTEGGYERHRIG